MEVLKSWALSVIAAAVITAVITFVSPSGPLEKSVKTVTALFMLLCFIMPLAKTDLQELFSVDVEHINEWIEENKLKKEVEYEAISVLKNEIITKISSYINEKGMGCSQIDVIINVTDNYNIIIEKISIGLYGEADSSEIIKYVEEEFAVTPEIVVRAED